MKTYSLALIAATASALSINVQQACDFDDLFEYCRADVMDGTISEETEYDDCVNDALDFYTIECEEAFKPSRCVRRATRRFNNVEDDWECLLTETCKCK